MCTAPSPSPANRQQCSGGSTAAARRTHRMAAVRTEFGERRAARGTQAAPSPAPRLRGRRGGRARPRRTSGCGTRASRGTPGISRARGAISARARGRAPARTPGGSERTAARPSSGTGRRRCSAVPIRRRDTGIGRRTSKRAGCSRVRTR